MHNQFAVHNIIFATNEYVDEKFDFDVKWCREILENGPCPMVELNGEPQGFRTSQFDQKKSGKISEKPEMTVWVSLDLRTKKNMIDAEKVIQLVLN